MKKTAKQLLALLLAVSMAFSMLVTPGLAVNVNEGAQQPATVEGPERQDAEEPAADAEDSADDEQQAEKLPTTVTTSGTTIVVTVEDQQVPITLNTGDIDVTVAPNEAVVSETAGDTEIDADNPAVTVVEEELSNIKVLNEDGESVGLTEEQIQTVLGLYQQYLDQWEDNADVLGVQMPFFLQYNDDGEDGLGILGEMLVLAGYTVDDVRNGNYSYDDLLGMVQNFYYADQYGIKYYATDIRNQRDAALKAVEDSGAETEVQKLLVLNDWLAQQATFDMAYIMNMGQEEPIMVAQDPQKHEHYDEIYNAMYDLYYDQISQQFHDQIYAGVEAQLRQQYYEAAIRNIVYQNALDQATANGASEEEAEAAANDAADQFMEENAEAIADDAAGFVEENFGAEAAAQLSAGADEFIEEAETKGVEVDPENAPGYKMTIEEITQQQMDQPLDDLGGMTPNEAVPVYAEQAATGLTNGIIGAWEGNHIGILAEGTGVCCGYAKAYAYLVQVMHPENYGVNGAGTDMTKAENWKTAKELYYDADGNLDINQAYNVDIVRITFDTDVTMYGQINEDFNSDHFWNAVNVDGTWFYVDPCYNDVYTEVMLRDRVETDGNMNHLYFMFSHTSAINMYDGYYSVLKTLYADAATDQSYEDAWVSRIASNTYSDGEYFYYVYDSADLITLLDDYNNNDYDAMEEAGSEYKLVRHAIDGDDTGDGDSDFETLIDFSYDDDSTAVQVYNPESGEMEENELLTKLFIQFEDECDIYSSIKITTALYEGKLYFNLSNCVLSYDLETGEVVLVKEYNTVSAKRDLTVAFGGMAFSVVDSEEDADLTVFNHPIASLVVKSDGNLYVSIATNFAYISGKDPHDCTDSDENGYGYEFEESNYNPNYNSYFSANDSGMSEDQLEGMGYSVEHNDNDEFMWSANFVETLSMSHLTGDSHTYEEVTVAPYCGRNGFTENRCTECGAIEADTRVEDEGSALDHHYVHYDEIYYTKDDDGNWNTGDCYVCTICGYAVDPSEDGSDEDWDESKDTYEMAAEKAGHVYTPTDAESVTWGEDEEGNLTATIASGTTLVCEPCDGRLLDVLIEQEEVTSITLDEDVVLTEVTKEVSGTCDEGLTTTYTATGTTADGEKISATKTETGEAGEHDYEATWTWTEVEDEDAEVPYTATLTLTCSVCGDTVEDIEATVVLDEDNSTEDTVVYKATATYEEKEYTDTKEIVLSAAGLETPEIVSVYSTVQDSVKVTWVPVEGADGYELFRALDPDTDPELLSSDPADEANNWIRVKTITDANAQFTDDGNLYYRNQQLTIGQTYYYMIRAFVEDEDGNRSYSAFSSVRYMPSAVVFERVYSNSTERIRLLWNEVGGSHGYQIWRQNDDGTWSIVKTLGDKGNTLTDDQGATTAYSNTGLEAGKTYTYKMRAFTIVEDGVKIFGAYSDEVTVAVMPVAPTLEATSSKAGRADLTWDAANGAAGYQIWMAESEDGTYSIAKSITDGDTTSYTKYDLESGKTYYFKVRAYTEVDGKKTFGAYSEVVSVTVK